ncbi:hypothetical protein [Dactylosporangium sp. CS-033363]|uniref:hypothetical protein n=1 Tax=Dactylosporangium sp. CS-033363 TaxID=3239935 RepID=UPI003D8E9DDA
MTDWHLDAEGIRRYAREPVPATLAASAEAHLMHCATCRDALASHVDPRRAEAIWREVADRVDVPRRTFLEKVLLRLGVGEPTARLVAATPTLRGPWLLAVAGVLVLAAWAAQADPRLLAMFLVAAPLGPLAGVGFAFAGGLDPTREIGLAAPYSGLRLLLIRTAAVLAVTVPIVAAAGLALPGSSWSPVAWLLPTAGLVGAALALTRHLAPATAVAVVSAGWVLLTAPITVAGRLELAFGIPAQAGWLALAVAGGVWLCTGRLERSA